MREHCERLELPYGRVMGRLTTKRLRGLSYPGMSRTEALDAGLRKPRSDIGSTHAKPAKRAAAV
jgi:hypothetical protein